ncbi:MAG: glycoside hydrolase family 30 protein [Firmicutes bacterium]|nr:glycoside hydrolase family 30 protein [Bacillota bacterium]
MRKSPVILTFLCLLLWQCFLPVGFAASEVIWTVTTEAEPWRSGGSLPIIKAKGKDFTIEIDKKTVYQEIDGFGGAFNEKGWEALSILTPEQREEALKALFDPQEGAKLNICRVPIGASDYAIDRYTLNETKDDFEMKDFSIQRDQGCLIPYIKAAMQYRPDLKIWGSVWTPPTWMKTNGEYDGGYMKGDPQIYQAFALYLARFLEAYQKEGIDAYAVAVQNEPTIETNYPSCLWTEYQFLAFIKDHIGPLFQERGVKGEIWLGTMQDADYTKYPKTVLSDAEANKYITTVGFQWDGLHSVAWTRKNYPEKKLMQTETECGNWYWKARFDPNKPQNDWNYGVYTWKKVKDYFEQGVNSYMLWNMVLDEEGKSIDSRRPWPQNAPLVVDRKTKSLIYTPMYYAFKHFSFFVKPGARLISVKPYGAWSDAIAFQNPDGGIALVMQNATESEKEVKIKLEKQAVTITLPPQSWSTLVLP